MLTARGLVVAPAGRAPDERTAAGPLDVELARGEWLTLLGGNGAGKSTLLATLAGLVPPVEGVVRLDGHDPFTPEGRRAARAAVGVVFQEPETQALTDAVAREIAFPLENLGWPRATIDARVDELLALFGLEASRAVPPSHLSGGEAQRLALAAAIAPRPGLLLLDEPDSYLDRGGRDALLEVLATLRARHGTAVVWSACDGTAGDLPGGRILDLGAGLPLGCGSPTSGIEVGTLEPASPRAIPSAPLWQARDLRLERVDERGRLILWGESGLTFTLGGGERVVVSGENGSGKTALLDALAGLVEPGRQGTLAVSAPPGGFGYLTQFPESQLFAETVRDDVGFALRHGRALPAAASRERVDGALARVGLDPDRAGDRAPDSLSLGEQRRVALAGILVGDPGAVLLDEPTAGLDRDGRNRLEEALERAAERGITLVVATHDPGWGARPGWRTVALPPPGRVPADPWPPVTPETA